MRDILSLEDISAGEAREIFGIADELSAGKYKDFLKGKTVVIFFPNSSIRTRLSFEKGIYLLGGQSVLFPPESLEKKEAMVDVCGYLDNWADLVVLRHRDAELQRKFAEFLNVPVINAMSDESHPCEMLSDLYTLSKIRDDLVRDKFLFCGRRGNIGLAWKEASELMGFELEQCCAPGYEIEGIKVHHDIFSAVKNKDIVCTDSLPKELAEVFSKCRVTKAVMDAANKGAVLDPCPPFYRGEEVSDDVISSQYFVGYEFKKHLLEVQQAIMIFCLSR